MTFTDYYNILGINKKATQTDIKNAYRKLARKYHPDLNPNDNDAKKNFQQIIEANEVMSNPENGQTIKISGHGSQGINGAPNGVLYITFALANHPKIRRLDNNLYTTVDLGLYIALLGGEITIHTLNGKVKLKLKPETQNGSKMKLKGKGFPVYKKEGHFGDLYLIYTLKIPTNLTDKQKALFTELSKF